MLALKHINLFSDSKPQPIPPQSSFNRPKLRKVYVYGSTTHATLFWSNRIHSAINLETVDKEACIYESSLEEEHGSRIVITGCAEEVKELQLTSETYGTVLAIVNLNGSVAEVQIGPIVERTQIDPKKRIYVDNKQTDAVDYFDEFDR